MCRSALLRGNVAKEKTDGFSQRWLRTVGYVGYGVADKGYAVFLFHATLGGFLRISS